MVPTDEHVANKVEESTDPVEQQDNGGNAGQTVGAPEAPAEQPAGDGEGSEPKGEPSTPDDKDDAPSE